MSRYSLDDGTIVDTAKAVDSWPEETDWNGNNHISRATGSQWEHERLYLSAKGRYYIEHTSQWQGSLPNARLVSAADAARWLMLMGHDLPEALETVAAEVSE